MSLPNKLGSQKQTELTAALALVSNDRIDR